MNQNRLVILLVIFSVTLVAAVGCNYLMLSDHLVGPNSSTPDFEYTTDLSLSNASRVVVVCHAPGRVQKQYEDVEYELPKLVTVRLRRHGIHTVEPQSLKSWLDTHSDWQQQQTIGKAFDADFVINLDLHQYRENVEPLSSATAGVIFEPDPHSDVENHPDDARNHLRSEVTVTVSVSQVNDNGQSASIYCKNVTVSFLETELMSAEKLKQAALTALSLEISRLFQKSFVEENSTDDYAVRFSDCKTSD